MKKIFIFLLALMLVFPFIASCKESGEISSNAESDAAEGAYDNMPNIVQIEMEDGGRIIVELYPDIAPITVRNFKKLVSEGFYDGLIFHRAISGFMI
ncbi:MAG: peptidylprolyl isomerase, partial [Eubacteriales bacterium]|nr:peptidylprolyl isomerase [Eubacteriales bacterium]